MKILPTLIITILFSFLHPVVVNAVDLPETSYLKVREAKMKIEPSFFAKSISNLKYGDPLTIFGIEKNWVKVKNNAGVSGYLHESLLSPNKIVFTSNTKFVPKSLSSADGIVMAGKGFNKEVEKKYASLNANLNYSAVDKMERISISDKQINNFVKAGNLK